MLDFFIRVFMNEQKKKVDWSGFIANSFNYLHYSLVFEEFL